MSTTGSEIMVGVDTQNDRICVEILGWPEPAPTSPTPPLFEETPRRTAASDCDCDCVAAAVTFLIGLGLGVLLSI